MNFVFTITTGRSGTGYLAELFRRNIPNAECYHERLGAKAWGLVTPDISTLMNYNHGRSVRDFWKRKADFIGSKDPGWYIETSHVHFKAGLIENLDVFRKYGDVHIICLHRNPEGVVASMVRRGDFTSLGDMWLWLLDPAYPCNRTRTVNTGQEGLCDWYVHEIQERERYLKLNIEAEYIDAEFSEIITEEGAKKLLQRFTFNTSIDLPGKINA